ncbi:fumarylacetoacetase [Caballeronia sp. 15711]|uniref:fumarylacetoacetase n=1 Tax=Caballeronia sp. 15711 TaxID=3391029 RepID=UPI0039E4B921
MMNIDHTHDVKRGSWFDSANRDGCDFPIQNLPFAVFRRTGSKEACRGAVAIGDHVLDLAAIAESGLLAGLALEAVSKCARPSLNDFFSMGPSAHRALRHALFALLETGASPAIVARVQGALIPLNAIEFAVPAQIGDYTDFYTSLDHALNVMRLLRPNDPLAPNFQWMPIAYHGRVSSIGVSGQRVTRPCGQWMVEGAARPTHAPCAMLDYELELGVYIGKPTTQGKPVRIEDADDHVFGLCLLNDWSARDIQWWEMSPLGPFLSKNFATTISPWIVTLDALAPFRTPWQRPDDHPQPLDYLEGEANREHGGIHINVEAWLETAQARHRCDVPVQLSRTSFCHQYWSIAQMISHHTSGGCNLNAGDLVGTGTISGPGEGEAGALIELSMAGKKPVDVGGGESRSFIEDGDAVILRGSCERAGFARIGFGESRGEVQPAVVS